MSLFSIYRKILDDESVGVVVGATRVFQFATAHQRSLRDIALTDNHLLGIGAHIVGIVGEVHHHAIDFKHLIDISRNDAVVVTLLREIPVVVVGTLVGQQQSAADIVLDG